jgi:hypothetical protein
MKKNKRLSIGDLDASGRHRGDLGRLDSTFDFSIKMMPMWIGGPS